jgi:hypothetical protein
MCTEYDGIAGAAEYFAQMTCDSGPLRSREGLKRLDYLIHTEQRTLGLLISEIVRSGVSWSKLCYSKS